MFSTLIASLAANSPANARYVVYAKLKDIPKEVCAGRYRDLKDAETATASLLGDEDVAGTRIVPISGADMYPVE